MKQKKLDKKSMKHTVLILSVGVVCMVAVGSFYLHATQPFAPRTRISSVKKTEEVRQLPVQPQAEILEQPSTKIVEAMEDNVSDGTLTRMRDGVINLVNRACDHLVKADARQALSDFMHDKNFASGGLYVFVYDLKGNVLADGEDPALLWSNQYDLKDSYGVSIGKAIIDVARRGGGWAVYSTAGNATKITYAREVKKNEQSYIVASGFYPHAPQYLVETMVKGAVQTFNDAVQSKKSTQEVFSTFSYPIGQFVDAGIYLFALDFDGMIVAQGEIPGLVGQFALDYKDGKGKFVNQEIISSLKDLSDGAGIWVDYWSKNALKRAYAVRVTDAQDKHYFIAAGYYPTITRDTVVQLVQQGKAYMKSNTIEQVSEAFNKNSQFVVGDCSLILIDDAGKVLSYRANPVFVGTNRLKEVDQSGTAYFEQIIKSLRDSIEGQWFSFRLKNSFYSVYAERVIVDNKRYYICSGVYSLSPHENMLLLVKTAANFLQANVEHKAFRAFMNHSGGFVRGDLSIFVIDTQGYCYAYLKYPEMMWENMFSYKDDDGKEYIKQIINTALKGAGSVTYRLNGIKRTTYAQAVKKGEKTYIVGSTLYE